MGVLVFSDCSSVTEDWFVRLFEVAKTRTEEKGFLQEENVNSHARQVWKTVRWATSRLVLAVEFAVCIPPQKRLLVYSSGRRCFRKKELREKPGKLTAVPFSSLKLVQAVLISSEFLVTQNWLHQNQIYDDIKFVRNFPCETEHNESSPGAQQGFSESYCAEHDVTMQACSRNTSAEHE